MPTTTSRESSPQTDSTSPSGPGTPKAKRGRGQRFAVIVPAHNAANFIEECLQSVAGADHCGWELEVIVLDDGSKDATGDLASQALDELGLPGRVLRNPKPQGVGLARRRAIAAADASVIMQVDADDLIRPHRFRDALKILQDPQVMLTAGNVQPFMNTVDRPMATIVMPTASEDVAASLLFYCPMWGSAISFKTELLGRFEMPKEAYGEDWCLTHRLIHQHGPKSVRNSGTTLIDYRRYPGQMTARAGAYMEAIMPVWSEILWEALGLKPDRETFELHCRCAPYALRETALLNDAQWQHWLQWSEEVLQAATARGRVPHATALQLRLAQAQLSMRRQVQRNKGATQSSNDGGMILAA